MPDVHTPISPPLRRRTQGLLRSLTMLGNAPTQSWRTDAAGVKRSRIVCPSCQGRGEFSAFHEVVCSRCRGRGTVVSKAQPHGSKQHHHDSAPPPRCDSLHDKFIGLVSYAFHNDDGIKLESLCVQMETELAHYRGVYRAEINLPSDDEAAMRKVIEVYEGIDSVDVARRLHVDLPWVEKARLTNRRNRQDGSRLEGWAGFSDEERLSHIHHAVDQGWSIRRAAETVGVPLTTLNRHYGHYWGIR